MYQQGQGGQYLQGGPGYQAPNQQQQNPAYQAPYQQQQGPGYQVPNQQQQNPTNQAPYQQQQRPQGYQAPNQQQGPGYQAPYQQQQGPGYQAPNQQQQGPGYQAPNQQNQGPGYQAPNQQQQAPGYQAPHHQLGPGYQAPNQQEQQKQQQLWAWFTTVDADRSGHITANELQQALTNSNWSHFNKETCRLMIGMFDRDQSGTIDFNEFCGLWDYIQQWKGVFDRYDSDKSGSIEEAELYRALQEMGFRLSQSFVRLVIVKFDTLSKRGLKFDDFIQCCVMLKSLTDSFRQKDTAFNGQITVSYEDFMCMSLANKP